MVDKIVPRVYFGQKKHFQTVEAVSFDYGQRHRTELTYAKEIAHDLSVRHHILDMTLLNQLAPSALTRKEAIIEKEGEIPSTFVPGRNLIFLSFASILAKQIGAKHIITGVSETDFSGYPDCRNSFIQSLNVTINLAMDDSFVVHTPLMWLDKKETWKLADELGAFQFIREKTVTCYNGIPSEGCGECPACRLRNNGLNAYLQEKEGERI